ncbi:MAG: DUF554 domain-containing protein [Clostridiales Family XIII bacterium]|jgi:uncharacterized membrane protein YqgA involved in biofilm formation|nr:DUF554 domain-containing protein [Clostridiales Family XIII bacterium]
MIGAAVNAATIAVCGLLGMFLLKNIPGRFEDIITKALGLSVIFVGIKGALDNQRMILLILSLVVGSVIGELFDIDKAMTDVGAWAERKFGFSEGNFSKGFVNASILFCTGSMAIVGAMQSGLQGNHETLFAKSILDGSISVIFASTMGVGVIFSALPVLIYEGGIALAAGLAKTFLTTEIITEMSAVGSLIVAAIGFNFLEIKKIKVANMIPAIFIPWLCIGAEGLIANL